MKLAIAVTALSTVALAARTNGQIVLQSAPPASKMAEGEYKVVCSGNADDGMDCCELRLQRDCNLVTRRKSSSDGPDDFEVSWDSGAHGGNLDCEVFLQGDGNLVIYRNNPTRDPVWATNTNSLDGLSHSYTLEFDSYKQCRLQIKQDGVEEQHAHWPIPSFWWQNINIGVELWPERNYAGGNNDPGVLLQRGEMVTTPEWWETPTTLYLQQDCNLVTFEGEDKANRGPPIWSTQTAGDAEECYLYGDCDKLVLYEGKFNKNKGPCANRGNRLWSTDWDWSESGELVFFGEEGIGPL